jgi:hypothetical protein
LVYTTNLIQLAATLDGPWSSLFEEGGIRLPLLIRGLGKPSKNSRGEEKP